MEDEKTGKRRKRMIPKQNELETLFAHNLGQDLDLDLNGDVIDEDDDEDDNDAYGKKNTQRNTLCLGANLQTMKLVVYECESEIVVSKEGNEDDDEEEDDDNDRESDVDKDDGDNDIDKESQSEMIARKILQQAAIEGRSASDILVKNIEVAFRFSPNDDCGHNRH